MTSAARGRPEGGTTRGRTPRCLPCRCGHTKPLWQRAAGASVPVSRHASGHATPRPPPGPADKAPGAESRRPSPAAAPSRADGRPLGPLVLPGSGPDRARRSGEGGQPRPEPRRARCGAGFPPTAPRGGPGPLSAGAPLAAGPAPARCGGSRPPPYLLRPSARWQAGRRAAPRPASRLCLPRGRSRRPPRPAHGAAGSRRQEAAPAAGPHRAHRASARRPSAAPSSGHRRCWPCRVPAPERQVRQRLAAILGRGSSGQQQPCPASASLLSASLRAHQMPAEPRSTPLTWVQLSLTLGGPTGKLEVMGQEMLPLPATAARPSSSLFHHPNESQQQPLLPHSPPGLGEEVGIYI